jgi:sprouty-related EVH1 domain-containing protein
MDNLIKIFSLISVNWFTSLIFSDETLVRVQAQVMTRDDSSGGWVPMGGGGLSYVGLVRRVRPAEDSTCKNEYLILGQRIADNSVCFSQLLKPYFF